MNDSPLSEQIMRDAISRRDPHFDGQFYYGVLTTGVFCRPSCAARPARPENLRFFTTIAEATSQGYRPCKRCKPVEILPGLEGLVDVARYIEMHVDEKISLEQLSSLGTLSPGRLQRKFKATFGVSPKDYQSAIRLRSLKRNLKQGSDVTGAIYEAGFGSSSRVYEKSMQHLGMTPGAYRQNAKGEEIFYTASNTSYGLLMMAATKRGVCFVQFGSSEEVLLQQLHKEFSAAIFTPSSAKNHPSLTQWVEALNAHLSEHAPIPQLPLDMRGTAFQISVWKFLISLKQGDVMSYAEVAAKVGKPKAFRAIASACAKNRIAILIPCHRVLRGDGRLGGYRWGLERKRALLDNERKQSSA